MANPRYGAWNHPSDHPDNPEEDDEVVVQIGKRITVLRYTRSGWGDIEGRGYDWQSIDRWQYPSVLLDLD